MLHLRVVISAGLLLVSELLPFLPCKHNGLLQAGFTVLHEAKLIPDAQYERLHAAGADQTAAGGSDRSSSSKKGFSSFNRQTKQSTAASDDCDAIEVIIRRSKNGKKMSFSM